MSKEYYKQLMNKAFDRKISPYTYSAKPKPSIDEWYKKWCEKTGRNGGILIGSSIKELLSDFKYHQP